MVKVTIFLMIIVMFSRWLRLLFGREFSLLDLLALWDAIFAEGKLFALTNYVVVQIRHQCEFIVI